MSIISNSRPVFVKMTDDSPQIVLDVDNSMFKIEGPSYPEDSYDVYTVVLEWILGLDGNVNSELICDFNFKVLSSASHKMVYEIIIKLEDLYKKTNNVIINWHYLTYDEDLFEIGEDFSDTVEVPFKFLPYED